MTGREERMMGRRREERDSVVRRPSSVVCHPTSDFRPLTSVLCLLLSASLSSAQTPTNALETWNDGSTAGWKRKDTLNGAAQALANSGSALSVTFAAQTMPVPAVDLVYADAEASQGRFIGDYSGVGAIRFKLYCATCLPAQARVYFQGGTSGNRWYYPLAGLRTGEWVEVVVPLEYGSGWRKGTEPTAEQFEADLVSVAWVGVRLQRNGAIAAQTYGLDDFELEAVGGGEDTGALPAWWVERYFGASGAGSAAAEPGSDPDRDGMNNYAEYAAGTDPTRGESVLTVDGVTTNAAGGLVIQWSSETNRWYTVDRATDLIEGFLGIESNIPGTPPMNVYEDLTATNAGPYFYRIEVRP